MSAGRPRSHQIRLEAVRSLIWHWLPEAIVVVIAPVLLGAMSLVANDHFKVCTHKVCTPKVGTPKVCTLKVCTPKVGIPKVCTPKVSVPELPFKGQNHPT